MAIKEHTFKTELHPPVQ